LLIDLKADVNTRDDFGCTPLHYAAFQGRCDIAQLLLDNGADPTIESSMEGLTPVAYAYGQRHQCQQIVELLEKYMKK
jgi:ankyrin repeat protein